MHVCVCVCARACNEDTNLPKPIHGSDRFKPYIVCVEVEFWQLSNNSLSFHYNSEINRPTSRFIENVRTYERGQQQQEQQISIIVVLVKISIIYCTAHRHYSLAFLISLSNLTIDVLWCKTTAHFPAMYLDSWANSYATSCHVSIWAGLFMELYVERELLALDTSVNRR